MTRAALLEAFAAFPPRLSEAARAAVGIPVPDGEWGPIEVVRHLIAVEDEVHQRRQRDLATQPPPRWSWAEPGPWPGEPDLTLDQLVTRFADLRMTTVATVRALDDTGWTRWGTHDTFGRLDVSGLLRLAIDHDAEHLAGLLTSKH